MEFLKLAEERYSVRKFKSDRVKQEDIDVILRAAQVAPTACNNQPQRILVMNSEESMAKLRPCTKCHFGAPTAMLICFDKREQWTRKFDGATSGWVDASIVTTHMMLAAASCGVGTTWVMYFNPEPLREAFAIPEEYEPAALLVMGYPAEDAEPAPLHASCKPLDETVFYESF